MLVLGSSLKVYPAASLPQEASGEVFLEPTATRYFVQQDLDAFFRAVANSD